MNMSMSMKQLLTFLFVLFRIQATYSSKIVTGVDLLAEMAQLQESLTRLQKLLNDQSVEADQELVNKAAKVFRRARWMIHSSNHEIE